MYFFQKIYFSSWHIDTICTCHLKTIIDVQIHPILCRNELCWCCCSFYKTHYPLVSTCKAPSAFFAKADPQRWFGGVIRIVAVRLPIKVHVLHNVYLSIVSVCVGANHLLILRLADARLNIIWWGWTLSGTQRGALKRHCTEQSPVWKSCVLLL